MRKLLPPISIPGMKLPKLPNLGVKDRVVSIMSRIARPFHHLNVSQRFYLVAMILLIVESDNISTEEPTELIIVGAIAFCGLIREILHLFVKLWDRLLGKSIILVSYAAIANFSLATAALKLNQVIGVEPTNFVFTLAFTTFLLMPLWIAGITVVVMALAMIVGQVWFILALLLRIIRIKLPLHWEDVSFPMLTMILRFVLIPVVLTAMFQALHPYIEQVDLMSGDNSNRAVVFIDPGKDYTEAELREHVDKELITWGFEFTPEEKRAVVDQKVREYFRDRGEPLASDTELKQEPEAETVVRIGGDGDGLNVGVYTTENGLDAQLTGLEPEPGTPPAISDESASGAELQDLEEDARVFVDGELTEEQKKIIERAADDIVLEEERVRYLDRMIAGFVYYLETYPRSRCVLEEGQHALSLNDYEVLIAEKDTSAELGFTFKVQKCVPASGAVMN